MMKIVNRVLLLALAAMILSCLPSSQAQTTFEFESDAPKVQPTQSSTTKERKYGKFSVDVPRTVEIALGNRSTGRITVVGWDRDTISARAYSERGDETCIYARISDGPDQKIFIKADYADIGSSDPAAISPELPPVNNDGPIQIHLEVNLPRESAIQIIKVIRSNVQITNIETPISILGDQSNIVLKQVGSAEAHTRSGNIEVEGSTGLLQLTTATGEIRIANARGGIRAVSIGGLIEVKCARGRVDVSNSNAPIDLSDVEGDVDAIASTSNVRLATDLRQDGRYFLKSISGRVEMILPGSITGFNATLSSYRGVVESDFPLKANRMSDLRASANRAHDLELRPRMTGQFGKGGPQIMLDSFEGVVRLTKVTALSTTCK
jgi:hypothetical protein